MAEAAKEARNNNLIKNPVRKDKVIQVARDCFSLCLFFKQNYNNNSASKFLLGGFFIIKKYFRIKDEELFKMADQYQEFRNNLNHTYGRLIANLRH